MRMNTKCFVPVVLLFSFIVLATPGHSQKLKKKGRYYIAEINKSFSVKPGASLIVKGVRGDVSVTTQDKHNVLIHAIYKMDVYTEAEAKAVMKNIDASYIQRGNKIEISAKDISRSYMSGRFEIQVPSRFNLDIQTSGGDVSIDNLIGDAELKTSGGDIAIKSVDGRVKAKTSGGDVSISRTKQQVIAKTSGGDIEIIEVSGPVEAKTSGGGIYIRRNSASIVANTSGGDIELVDVGAAVEAHTSGGDIDVTRTNGSIEVSTSGGDIDLRNIGGAVKAATSGGDIDASGVKGGIAVKTSGGDINLSGIHGFIEAKTSGGDIEADMALSNFAQDHHVDMHSSGGDLMLTIPAKLPATIHAEISYRQNARHRNEFRIKSDFELQHETSKDGSEIILKADGKINGGGDLINLSTSHGNITIKHK